MLCSGYDPEKVESPLWKLISQTYPNLAGNKCRINDCKEKGLLTCTGCFLSSYCSRDHQKQDWSKHKGTCSPFKIVNKQGFGRYLVATRDIKPGEIIFTDYPMAVGPKQYTRPVCLGCHAPVSLDGHRCSSCSWPMCSQKCEYSSLHRAECKIFSSAGVKPTSLRRRGEKREEEEKIEEHPMYECITPLRVCLSMVYRPHNWEVVKKMETHRSARELEENSLHNQHNVVSFLLKYTKLQEQIDNISGDDILRSSDVLDVNAFEIRGVDGISLRGLYPLTAMMNSSCSPNTQNSIDNNFTCRVRAVQDIKKGEEICDTYTSTLSNTIYRQKHLLKSKYFLCSCPRCSDPSELGSDFSSIKCRRNPCDGFMLNSNPLNTTSPFRCGKCGFEKERKEIESEQEFWEEKIENSLRDITTQEELLRDISILYHPNHNMCIDIMFNLIPLYGAKQSELLEVEAERKEKICESILETMNKLIPGMFSKSK
ncbi:protein msta [Eurytemora carolleeae]|uniref:protein msta n=1 Tax=Eurytemora carolleeae TaxID=1294199 RepID=UPI000C781263|nr:protein msta [Eurytemora carolleeae]|eukprot:XP_023337402.1 protein msta-like [Eurytemora affinis]